MAGGAAIATYNDTGVWLQDGSAIVSTGTPLVPNWFVRYSSVQEQPLGLPSPANSPASALTVNAYHTGSLAPSGQYRFTRFTCPASGGSHFYDNGGGLSACSSLVVRDSEIWGGANNFSGDLGTSATLQNNFFGYSFLYAAINGDNFLAYSNNLFWNTTVMLNHPSSPNRWQFHNNAFDTCYISTPSSLTNSHNAYINCSGRLQPPDANDVVLTSFSYAAGPLGNFYQTSPDLVDRGSTTADAVGLYHYTTRTSQVKETNSVVDIGYHYVALTPPPSADIVWVEDSVPDNASQVVYNDSWTWVWWNPPPYSGALCHQSDNVSGIHQHYFENSSDQLTLGAGDALICYVYLDPYNLPQEVMLQWRATDGTMWEPHRAYWGADLLTGWGGRTYMGPLPPAGGWVRLQVSAGDVGLVGRTLQGMAFTLYDGTAAWDHAGKNAWVASPPADTDGGGVPDYLEDANGNGLVDTAAGETDWTSGHGSDDTNYYTLTPQYLRCEYRVDPWGVTTNYGPPRLFWIVTSPRRATFQLAYQIQVATSANNLNANNGDVWDSGKVYSDATTHVEYNGPPLASGQHLWWRVRSWDRYAGLASGWSTNGFFQVGLLDPLNDWAGANWIAAPGYQPGGVCPMFRSTNIVLTKPIASATAYVTAKGMYELWINGQRIGPNILAPEWTDFNCRVQYQTYDVGPYLNSGSPTSTNVIGAFVGEGWCFGDTDYPTNQLDETTRYYGPRNPQFLLRINVTNTDNSATTIATDPNWTCSLDGAIRSSFLYNGETFDATKVGATPDWSTASTGPFATSVTATPVGWFATNLFAQPNEPIRITQILPAVRMWTTGTSGSGVVTNVFDLGQNMVGWCNLTVINPSGAGASGWQVQVRHAEGLLLDSNNNGAFGPNTAGIYMGNLGQALQTETYILNSNAAQLFHPHFTYHGFRFVEVTAPQAIAALLTTNSLSGAVFHSGGAFTGGFACWGTDATNPTNNWVLTNGLINKLVTNTLWTIRGNIESVFTGTTQRREREGYIGNGATVSQLGCFGLDLAGFFTKWLRDIREAQGRIRSDGGYTDYAPWDNLSFVWPTYTDPAVQAAGLIYPWRVYQNYGDRRLLAEHYASAKKQIAFLANLCGAGSGSWGVSPWDDWHNTAVMDWSEGDMFDWLFHGSGPSGKIPYGWPEYPPAVSATVQRRPWGTAWSAYAIDLAANMAQALGQSSDYAYFTSLAAMARTAYTNAGNGIVQWSGNQITGISSESQGDCMTALYFNMLPDLARSNALWLMVSGPYGIANYNSGYTTNGYNAVVCTNHFSTGYYLSGREMLELSRDGYTGLAYQLLMDTKFPSWLYPVISGSTTFWESPTSYLPGRNYPGVTDRGYYPLFAPYYAQTSLNVPDMCAVGEWVWRVVGGINPDDSNPGFKNVIIKPEPGGGVTNGFTSFSSINGPIVCSWTNSSGTYTLNLTNPANTTATVYLPSTNNPAGITESGRPATAAPGVFSYYFTNWPNWSNGVTVFQVGSGAYSFVVTNASF